MNLRVRKFAAALAVLLTFVVTACREEPSAQDDAEMRARIIGTWVLNDGPLSLYYMEKTYVPDGTSTGFVLNRQTGKRINFTSRWEIKNGYFTGEVTTASDPAMRVGVPFLNKIIKLTDKQFVMIETDTGRVTFKHRKRALFSSR
jgi:hypothetical protein